MNHNASLDATTGKEKHQKVSSVTGKKKEESPLNITGASGAQRQAPIDTPLYLPMTHPLHKCFKTEL